MFARLLSLGPLVGSIGQLGTPRGGVVRLPLLMESKALSVAKKLLSKAWSGSTMLEGVSGMMVKEELPDDPQDLLNMIQEPKSLIS